ncbi:MAG: permease prefix domain 1-containing protein [Candidatus Acidiferrales bacterium]
MLNDLWIRLRSLFRRNAVETELDAELRFHFDQHVQKLVASGLPLAEARLSPLREVLLSDGPIADAIILLDT